jgi:hypothetical protein
VLRVKDTNQLTGSLSLEQIDVVFGMMLTFMSSLLLTRRFQVLPLGQLGSIAFSRRLSWSA